jgi:hypothetical protein
MVFHVDAGFDNGHAFAFEEFSLEGGVRLANQKLAVCAQDAMPGDAFSGRASSHRVACGACAAAETQESSERPVG